MSNTVYDLNISNTVYDLVVLLPRGHSTLRRDGVVVVCHLLWIRLQVQFIIYTRLRLLHLRAWSSYVSTVRLSFQPPLVTIRMI